MQRVGLNFQNLKHVSTVVMLTVKMTIQSTWHGSVDMQGLRKKRDASGENGGRLLSKALKLESYLGPKRVGRFYY